MTLSYPPDRSTALRALNQPNWGKLFDAADESSGLKLHVRGRTYENEFTKEKVKMHIHEPIRNALNTRMAYIYLDGERIGYVSSVGMLQIRKGTLDVCSTEIRRGIWRTLLEVNHDPEKGLRDVGIATGICACCGRELTDPESIARGIGPVCYGRITKKRRQAEMFTLDDLAL